MLMLISITQIYSYSLAEEIRLNIGWAIVSLGLLTLIIEVIFDVKSHYEEIKKIYFEIASTIKLLT